MRFEKLTITRKQLEQFLPDHESIKQFERLFSMLNSILPPSDTDASVSAATADSKAQEALDYFPRLVSALEALASQPNGQEALEAIPRIASALEALASTPPAKEDNSVVTDYIDLPEIGPHVTRERRIQWNRDDGTLDVGLYNGVVLQCGQEIHVYAKNDEAITIENGSAVMVTGAVGASGKIKVKLAIANGTVDENYMLGIATQDIQAGEFGYITVIGLVRGFDTTGADKTVPEVWADGDVLYFDPAFPGELTKNEPVAPKLDLPIAIVVNAGGGGSGSIAVRMKTGERVNGLHDVEALAPRDLDLLQYNNALKRWESGALPWVDIDFPIIVRTVGPNIPTLVAINGNLTMPQWAVNDFNMCESQEFIHGWKEGSEVFWHLHLTTNGLDATNRYVRFEVEYGYVDAMGVWVFPAVLTTADLLIPANTPSKTMMIMSLGSFTPPIKIGGHAIARLRRIASVGAAPTNNPWIPMLQLHVQLDTIGSRNIGTK